MGWEHGFPSPSSALFVKQVMVQAEECGWPRTSRPRLSLFSRFHPCLVLSCPVFLTISSCYFTPLLPVVARAHREPQEHAKGREMVMVEQRSQGCAQTNGPVRGPVWGWASLALIICRKFSDMYLGIALSVSVEEVCKEIAV